MKIRDIIISDPCNWKPDDPKLENISPRGRQLAKKCINLISRGNFRCVFEYHRKPQYVIKANTVQIERENKNDANWIEYDRYQYVKNHHPQWLKWFAECIEISPCGVYLVQRRAKPMYKSNTPIEFPYFLSMMDNAIDNLGVIDGQIVTIDYNYVPPGPSFEEIMEKYGFMYPMAYQNGHYWIDGWPNVSHHDVMDKMGIDDSL